MTRRSLERKFKENYNRTPLAELHRLRLARAKHLLAQTDQPISKVAESLWIWYARVPGDSVPPRGRHNAPAVPFADPRQIAGIPLIPMIDRQHNTELTRRFAALYGRPPAVVASAPGRLEVLGNHTDYNAGLTLSCAVGFRCGAALAMLNEPLVKLSSTAFDQPPESFSINTPLSFAPPGHWANYVLGLVGALQDRGHCVPGFTLLIDSAVPTFRRHVQFGRT